jgi:uncharacterized protein
MDVTPLIRKDAKVIQSYKGGVFKVSGQVYSHSIIVLAGQVIDWPDMQDFATLIPYKDDIEVLLYGTGEKMAMPDQALKRRVKEELGISLEAMDNGAAARTYNVLMAEGRKVAAALRKE